MSKEYPTYLNHSFSGAIELHGSPKPVDVVTYLVEDGTKEFSPHDLIKTVLSARRSRIDDDHVVFEGTVVEPPELAGKEALLDIKWRAAGAIFGILEVQ